MGAGARLCSVRSVALAVTAVVLILIACAGPATPEAAVPAVASARDARFQLQLQAPRTTYGSADAIEPIAFVTWLGPGREEVFHAASPVGFRISEIGGGRAMDGGMETPCLSTPMVAGEPLAYPFQKAGAIADDPREGFDEAWYRDPVLRLPPGHWQIVAYLWASFGDCGGEEHQLETSIVIVVAP